MLETFPFTKISKHNIQTYLVIVNKSEIVKKCEVATKIMANNNEASALNQPF